MNKLVKFLFWFLETALVLGLTMSYMFGFWFIFVHLNEDIGGYMIVIPSILFVSQVSYNIVSFFMNKLWRRYG